jgi:glucose/arabinose dehydrogenase
MRRAALPLAALAACAILASCGGGKGGKPAATAIETKAPTQPSATAAPPVAGAYGLVSTMEQVSLNHMLAFVPYPGRPDEAVVATQEGQLWRVSLSDAAAPVLFGDLSDLIIKSPGREEGFLGIAFSPDFANDARVVVHYTAGDPRRGVIATFAVRNGAIDRASEQIVIEVPQPFPNHNGGALVFGPDGYLYMTLGDGGSEGDPAKNGQDLATLYGKILRLDVTKGGGYTVPPDNPFVDTPNARPEIYAYGFRNPWRVSFDGATGDLWAGDVGQDKWEETDRVVAGANYGWSVLEGFECYAAPSCDRTGKTPPRSAYSHQDGCAVIGGYVYRGAKAPELRGWYVYADFCSGKVWAANARDSSDPVLLFDSGLTISSFGELPNGELVALSYENVRNGIYELERAQ